jgi:hypothetical protein
VNAFILGGQHPGGDVGVVVEAGDDDFVAGCQVRAIERLMCRVRVVMLLPKMISSALAAL